MSFEQRPSPARVTAVEAAKLPRWMLAALLVAYITPGLLGRDPWSIEDAAAFGLMWTMAEGSAVQWLLPGVLGEPVAEEGPLPFWVGAALIRLFGGWLNAIDAARLASLIWFALASSSLWYATYRLARRSEAQPVAFAFGGQASARDFGRMVADIAVLLMIATLGIALRLHEVVAETALFAWVAVLLLMLVLSLDLPWRGTLGAALALAAVALTRGMLPAMVLAAAAVWFTMLNGPARLARSIVLVIMAVAITASWPLAALTIASDADAYFAAWWRWNVGEFGPGADNWVWLARNAGWYLWPLWPFALWTLYSWRNFIGRPHIQLPLIIAIGALAGVLLSTSASDREMIATVPPIVMLAALGVPVLRRSAEDTIDWFSIAMFSLLLLGLWVYFLAWHTGFPPRMAASVERLVPGLPPVLPLLGIAVGVLASIGWMLLSSWRLRTRPQMLWRGPFLAAGGLTVLWMVAVSLLYEAVDYNRSYEPTAQVLGQQVQRVAPNSCVDGHHLPVGTRAMLGYHGALRFERAADEPPCRAVIHRDSRRSQLDDAPPLGDWRLAYEHTRRVRYDEVFRVWVRPAR